VALVMLGWRAEAEREVDWSAVDDLFAEYDRSGSPGCGLGVVRDGVLEYGRGYGMANLDHGIAITPQTVFRTGSVGKQFTAAAIAIAAREGAISLDDPLRRWITDLPAYPTDPTIRQVVHHTSGLRDYLTLMRLRGLRDDDYYTNAEVREAVVRQRELNFPPGSDYLYSNSGYFLLGEVIREATGMTLREYAESRIFAPLGMTHSHFHDDHTHVVSNRATGYAPRDDGYRISVTTLDMVGDGGVFTSVEDLARWVTALNDDRVGPGLNAVLESTRPLTSGEANPYAFGQRLGVYRGARTVSHGGSFVGYRAAITRFPDQGLSIVLACNRADADPSTMALRVADVVLADALAPEAVAPESSAAVRPAAEVAEPEPVGDPDRYVGRYYSPELDVEYRLFLEDGVLRLAVGQGIDAEVGQIGPDHLRAAGLELRFRGPELRATGFEVDAGRVRNLSFERVEERPTGSGPEN
jgi:CubicO group peptidase (beta-lactamase class C family)